MMEFIDYKYLNSTFKLLPKINDKIKETAFAIKENKELKVELEKFKK